MVFTSSETAVIPQRFCGLRVLLVEHDRKSLNYHALVLSQNSYRVTSTHQPSTALYMIAKGRIHDCVLADADMWEMDGVEFLNRVMVLQPELPIIMMASPGNYMNIASKALKNGVICCLPKPCGLREICRSLWQHVNRNKRPLQHISLKGKSVQGKHDEKVVIEIEDDPMPDTQQGPKHNEKEIRTEFEPVTYEDLFGSDDEDDDAISADGNIHMEMASKDKGKQPMEEVNKRDKSTTSKIMELVEDERPRKKQKTITNLRIAWTSALHGNFLDALNALGGKEARPAAILKHMNVPDLTRDQVASHLQKYREGINHMDKKLTRFPPVLSHDYSSSNTYVDDSSMQLTTSGTRASTSTTSSSFVKPPASNLNSAGNTYMSIETIKDLLQGAQGSPTPSLTTANMNNCGGSVAVQAPNSSSNDPMLPQRMSEMFLGGTYHSMYNSNNGHSSGSSGGAEVQIPYYGFGSAKEPRPVGETSSNLDFTSDLASLVDSIEVPNYDLGTSEINFSKGFAMSNSGGGGAAAGTAVLDQSTGDPTGAFEGISHSQDFQGKGKELLISGIEEQSASFNAENCANPSYPDKNSTIDFLLENVDYSIPPLPEEGVNSQAQMLQTVNTTGFFDGDFNSMDDGSFPSSTLGDSEMILELLDKDDESFINPLQ